MKIAEIWRYPVKSLQGERIDSARVSAEGIEGDRRFAIFNLETGLGVTARRDSELLFASARTLTDGPAVHRDDVEITLPDGSIARDDAALSTWLGRPVALRSTAEVTSRQFETVDDFEHEDTSTWHPFEGSTGAFHDGQHAQLSLVSFESLGDWDRRRFRPNIVLDGGGENALVGSRVQLGSVTLDVVARLGRCVMITRPQPGGIDKDLTVLRSVHREFEGRMAVGASVAIPGSLAVGDEILLPVASR